MIVQFPIENVPFQLLSSPPFFTKSVVPETELKAQVFDKEMLPALVKVLVAVKEELLIVMSPAEVVMEKLPFKLVLMQLKEVGLKKPFDDDVDCVKRFRTNEPFVKPEVKIAPEDCVDVPDDPPNSTPPEFEQFKVMLFEKVFAPLCAINTRPASFTLTIRVLLNASPALFAIRI